ncbi:MAG: chemotaxis protein MotB [Desulfuromonadales bacterium]|nr:chemotaxis protein MotB [Desulfuromonadales bacterium]
MQTTHKLIIAGLAMAVLTAGCVSQSAFQRKSDEARHYATLSSNLEQDYAKLLKQQKQLAIRYDETARQLEDVRSEAAALRQDNLRAESDIERLETILADRSAAAGEAMTEMRHKIDRLEQEKRQLTVKLEQEQLARQARIAQLKTTYDDLVDKLEDEIERGEITISDLEGRLTVNMVEKILFDSGKADIKPAGLNVLRRIGTILKDTADKTIRVEGHTDNVPISPRLRDTYPSNWELATARAGSVVHFLQDNLGIPGERLSICGYGPYRPIADNATVKGRSQNRRIQIVLVPMQTGARDQ